MSSFGFSNNAGGFGSNNNANNTSSPFGGFGSTANNNTTTNTGFGASNTSGGFGTGGNTAGGLFGNTGSTNTGFGSGGFGSNNNQSSGFGASRPGFGSSNTATSGGGLFGSTSTNSGFGSGGFGSTNNNTTSGFGSNTGSGLFGSTNQNNNNNNNSGGLFGGASSSGGFGSSNTNTGFGNTNTGFGSTSNAQNNGTVAMANFQPYTEKEGTGVNQANSNFQSITFHPQYNPFSFEELRTVDYAQGRKFGNANGQAGAFGQSTGFGGFGAANNTNNASSGFGSSTGGGLFGQQNNNNTTTGGFGSQNNTTGGFGSTPQSGGLFGQKPASGGGLFGSTPASSTQQSGGLFGTSGNTSGGFGSTNSNNNNNNNTSGGLFGAKPFGSTGTPTTGGFGTSSNTTFGSNNQQQQNTGGGLFGNNQNQGGFGTNNQTSSGFGSGSVFGQNNQQNNQNQTTGAFGSAFGSNNQQQQQKPGGLFGSNTGGSLFGNNNNNTQPNQQSGGLFGSTNNQQSGGLFGSKPAGTNAFGSTQSNSSTGGGLFSNMGNNQNQQNSGGSLFGNNNNQNQSGGLFGSNNNSNSGGGGLFGNLNQNNNNQQQQGNSLFGSSNNQQQGGSLFMNQPQTQQQQQQPQQLNASTLSMNPYGNEPLFASLGQSQQPVGPLATPLSMSKRPPRKQTPLSPKIISPAASSRLVTPRNGYSLNYSLSSTPASAYGSSSANRPSLLGGRSGSWALGKSLSTSNLRDSYNNTTPSIFRPDAFKPTSQSYRSPGSMKRLHIDRSLRTTDLFGSGAGNTSSTLKKNVRFDNSGADGHANGDKEASEDNSRALTRVEENDDDRDSATPSAEELGYLRSSRSSRLNADRRASPPEMEQVKGNELTIVHEDESRRPTGNLFAKPRMPEQAAEDAEEVRTSTRDQALGDYYLVPAEKQLRQMSRQDLRSIKNLVVGRHGAGEITFDEVNLDGIDLDTITGEIVVLEIRRATVYPDKSTKPPPGKGLNVPAQITLDNSWPRAAGGVLPVQEIQGPRFDRHLKRLKKVEGTEFIEYKINTGQWIFRVQHFSSYGLDYEEFDQGLDSSILSAPPDTPTPLSSRLASKRSASSQASQGAISSNGTSNIDDTFEFRRSRPLPGAFDSDDFLETNYGLSDSQRDLLQSRAQDTMDMDFLKGDNFTTADPLNTSEFINNFNGMDGTVESSETEAPPREISNFRPRSILKTSQRDLLTNDTPPKHVMNDDWANHLQRTLSPKKQDRRMLRQTQGQVLDRMAQQVETSPTGRGSKPFTTSVDVMNSLFGAKSSSEKKSPASGKSLQWPNPKRTKFTSAENAKSQNDEAFHASFKPSWNVDGTIVLADTQRDGDDLITIQRKIKDVGRDIEIAKLATGLTSSASFEKQRQLTEISFEDDVPTARLPSTFSFAEFASSIDSSASSPWTRNEKMAFQLAQILFDSQDPSLSSQETARVRQEHLSQFWKSVVTPSALEHARNAKTSEEKAIAYLSADDVWDATEVLLQGGDYRLGTMISQLGGNTQASEGMRSAIAEQIRHWRNTNILSEITPNIRALYEILAGNPCVSEGVSGAGPENKAETFNISEKFGLDWRRAFGLRLWYGASASDDSEEDSILSAILSYHDDLVSHEEHVRPTPWFVRDPSVKSQWNDTVPQRRQDLLWGLLKIYAAINQSHDTPADAKIEIDLADILAPANISGNPLDARLSWQLYSLFSAQNIVDFYNDKHEAQSAADEALHKEALLTSTLIAQLTNSASDLPSAVFTALHLRDEHAKTQTINALLSRHAAAIGASPSTCATFRSLTSDLKIPTEWIYRAKALHFSSVLHDHAQQVTCLLDAGPTSFREAHDVLLRTVAPTAVVEEDLSSLKELLHAFEENGADKSTRAWEHGGAVYKLFTELMDLKNAMGHTAAEERKAIIRSLKPKLEREVAGRVEQHGLLERAARWEMRRVVRSMADIEGGEEDEEDSSGAGAMAVDKASSGEDSEMEGAVMAAREDAGTGRLLREAIRLSEDFYEKFAAAA